MFFNAHAGLEYLFSPSYRPSPSCANPGLAGRGPFMLGRGPIHFMLLATRTFNFKINVAILKLVAAKTHR